MDKGSTRIISILYFVVESLLKCLKSYSFYSMKIIGGKAKDYIQSLSKGLCHLQLAGISIDSIVIDKKITYIKYNILQLRCHHDYNHNLKNLYKYPNIFF